MTDALVSALRQRSQPGFDRVNNCYSPEPDTLCHDAADAIDRLTRERDEAAQECQKWFKAADQYARELSAARAELAQDYERQAAFARKQYEDLSASGQFDDALISVHLEVAAKHERCAALLRAPAPVAVTDEMVERARGTLESKLDVFVSLDAVSAALHAAGG